MHFSDAHRHELGSSIPSFRILAEKDIRRVEDHVEWLIHEDSNAKADGPQASAGSMPPRETKRELPGSKGRPS